MDNKKEQELAKIINGIKGRRADHVDQLKYDCSNGLERSYDFLHRILQLVNGHSGMTYFLDKMGWDRSLGLDDPLHYSPEKINPKATDFLQQKISKGVVLDLGCGAQGTGYILADILDAMAYLGVEMNFAKTAKERCEEIQGDTPCVIFQEDMSAFMSHFARGENKADTIIWSGIDFCSNNGHSINKDFFRNIKKSLNKNGLLIVGGNVSPYLNYMNEEVSMLDSLFTRSSVQLAGWFIIYEH